MDQTRLVILIRKLKDTEKEIREADISPDWTTGALLGLAALRERLFIHLKYQPPGDTQEKSFCDRTILIALIKEFLDFIDQPNRRRT